MSRSGSDKPYTTYRSGHARRRRGDDELAAGLETARGAERRGRERPPQRPERRSDGEGEPRAGARAQRSVSGSRRGVGATHRRRFRWWFIPLGLLLLLALTAGVFLIWAWPKYSAFAKSVEAADRRLPASAAAALTPDEGSILSKPTTILVLGVDTKNTEPARSDTIMLLRVDPKKHTISQLSIPRDTRVDLGKYGMGKINAAHFWGGPALAIKTISAFAGTPINHVMIVNFRGFARLVDAVGGVDMYVPETVHTLSSSNTPLTFPKGWFHFNGVNALHYVRERHQDDDFHRMARQQIFLQALQKKIASPHNFSKIPDMARIFMSGVATDLKPKQIVELAYLKWRTPSKNESRLVMLGTPQMIGGQSYVIVSKTAAGKAVDKFLSH